MSEGIAADAASALSGTKNILIKAAPWLAMLAGVLVGSFINGMIYNAIFRMAGVEKVIQPYLGDWTMRTQWAIVGGIMAAIGVAVWRMMGNVVGHAVGGFFIGCGIRAVIDFALGTQGPFYTAPTGGQ
jgi:hypothetical protein